MEVPLLTPLSAGTCYYFEMYISSSDYVDYTTDAIGAYFSDTLINNIGNQLVLTFVPQISNTTGVFDTLTWRLVAGNFTATGGESYLIIGNFKNDANTYVQQINNNNLPYAYVLVDAVSLTICTDIDEEKNKTSIHFSPNPVKQNLSFTYNLKNKTNCTLQIYNVLGQKVFAAPLDANAAQQKINVAFLNTGVYYCRLWAGGEVVGAGRFVKE